MSTERHEGGRDASERDVRPLVGEDRGNRPLWLAIAGILVLGFLLFTLLDSRRRAMTAPAVRPHASDLANAATQALPPLYIPPEQRLDLPQPEPVAAPPLPTAPQPLPIWPPLPAPGALQGPGRTEPFGPPPAPPPAPALPVASNGPAIIFDATVAEPSGAATTAASPGPGGTPAIAVATRARAGRLLNAPTIVPQGTLIAAVLETALDSTQPGQTRALVSRDVVNLRGDRILIPRGSRLFGTYRGELSSGQKRAQVEWTRLVRPDGVVIDIDSPAADRLGRAGIGGHVNTHFLERLGGALLQSSIDIGTSVASQKLSDNTLVIALPRSAGSAASPLIDQAPKPTLRVRQGTRISVFVARDLDFTGVEAHR